MLNRTENNVSVRLDLLNDMVECGVFVFEPPCFRTSSNEIDTPVYFRPMGGLRSIRLIGTIKLKILYVKIQPIEAEWKKI